MRLEYYLYKDGKQMGPLSAVEIVSRLESGQLILSDYYYDGDSEDWKMLVENPEFASSKTKAQPHGTAKPSKANVAELHHEFFVLKGEEKYGPYSYHELVTQLQAKTLFEYDYIWNSKDEGWVRVAEHRLFRPEKIKELYGKDVQDSEVFFRRRYMRAPYPGSVVVHNDQKVWGGEGIEVSEGGAGLFMHNPLLKPGDVVFVHFKPCEGVEPFQARAEIVHKSFMDGGLDFEKPVKYGIRFMEIGENARQGIKDFVHSKVQAA
jgi:hypothetical protein